MSMIEQKTYTCRCGKKNALPVGVLVRRCGCGRTASLEEGKVVLKDKPLRKSR